MPGNILITGASGLVGTALSSVLETNGFTIYKLDRVNSAAPFYYDQESERVQLSSDIPLEAVINLAGASIADGRWTKQRKQTIWNSRVKLTELLCDAIVDLPKPPRVLLSASAIGFYGHNCNEIANEESPAGSDFLADLSVAWEAAANLVKKSGVRVVNLRFGLVLSRNGGVLANLLTPFGLAVVGRLADGKHLQSWIHIDDATAIVAACIEQEDFAGAINLVAPEVVNNQQFAQCMSEVFKRPKLPPMPAALVRLLFGEIADAALLASANIQSRRLEELNVNLKYPTLRESLQALIRER